MSVVSDATTQTVLGNLARYAGGRHYVINTAADLEQPTNSATKVAVALRNSYVLTFQSRNTARDGGYCAIEVELVPPRGIPTLLSIHRAGYFATVH